MDPNAIASLVGSLGFPIVCCGALFWYQNKTMKEFSEKIENSIKELSSSIQNNTEATSKLVTTVELLTRLGGEVGENSR